MHLPTGSDESVMMTSKAFWFCFINSKPSPTWRVSFGLKKPLAMPGRNFFETSMTSYARDTNVAVAVNIHASKSGGYLTFGWSFNEHFPVRSSCSKLCKCEGNVEQIFDVDLVSSCEHQDGEDFLNNIFIFL